LLDQGAVYFCCWGPGCERTHDIAHEEVQVKEADEDEDEDSVIMTTWHDQEEMTEVIEFSLTAAEPDEAFSSGCNAVLVISVGSIYWAAQAAL
jgi:hypothetical protein